MTTSPHIAAIAARSIFRVCALLLLLAVLALPVFAQEEQQDQEEGPTNHAATGVPVITGVPATGDLHVTATLGVDVSGITDQNGLKLFFYQWIAVDGGTETPIRGATGPTYTLTAAETGKQIKVWVWLIDADGFREESLLRSAAVGPVEPLPAPTPGALSVFRESQNGFAMAWIEAPHAAEYKLEVKKHSEGDDSWVRVTKGDFGPLPGGLSSYSLFGVATGLDCGTAYDARLSIRGDGKYYEETFGAPLLKTTHTRLGQTGLDGAVATTECAQVDRITNLRRTVEPGVVTLTWTAPTDAKYTGFKVLRINLVDDQALANANPQDALTTLYESNNDSRTRYEDRTMLAGYTYAHIVIPIERQSTENGTTYRAVESGRAQTGDTPLGPTSRPNDPRNVRFTSESHRLPAAGVGRAVRPQPHHREDLPGRGVRAGGGPVAHRLPGGTPRVRAARGCELGRVHRGLPGTGLGNAARRERQRREHFFHGLVGRPGADVRVPGAGC